MIAESVESLFFDDSWDALDGNLITTSEYYIEQESPLNTPVTSNNVVSDAPLHQPKKSFFKRINDAIGKFFLQKV